jgi:DNA ligase (NAD+)
MNDKTRIAELERQIRHHNERYYDQDSPEISDLEYDKLKSELQKLAPDSPVFDEIGNPVTKQKVKHTKIVASLPKCHTHGEIVAKFGGQKVAVMPKIDGLSLTIRYEGGKLVLAATRGNGLVGEDVTANVAMVENVPKQIEFPERLEVRGEGYIAKKDFYGVMDQPGYGGKPEGFANPRNAAAGSVRHDDPKVTAQRNVRFVAYKAIFDTASGIADQHKVIEFLKQQGFEVCDCCVYDLGKEGDDTLMAARIDSLANEQEGIPYNIDGAVILIDNVADYEAAGITGKYPKGGLAYKFETEKASSVVEDVVWTTTRQGRVVPVAIISPTEICESVVARITMNNLEWLESHNVAVGDKILFQKANEIIPNLVDVLSRAEVRDMKVPSECPSCGTPLKRDGVDLVCEGESCPAQFLKYIRHILVKLGIKNIAMSTLTKLEEKGLLKNPWDIFDITLLKLASADFGPGESLVWIKAVTGVKTTPEKLLACMGIACWGERMFELLFKNASGRGVENWTNAILATNKKDLKDMLESVKGVGPAKAKALLDGLDVGRNVVSELKKRLTVEYPVQNASGEPQKPSKSFLITGTLSKTRNLVEDDIRAAGGVLKGSVSKNLDFLVVGEEPGSKVDKARVAGVKMIGEAELYEMIGKGL